jgi:hypothetical protein
MCSIWDDLVKDPSKWLTFFTTFILGCLTAYFAWRTRQLERQQSRQINREFDRELADAAAEINRGLVVWYYWQSWKDALDSMGALETYKRWGSNLTRPDLPKLQRILAFHLPDEEKGSSEAVVHLDTALSALDQTLATRSSLGDPEILDRISRVESALSEAASRLQKTLDTVQRKRERLRK